MKPVLDVSGSKQLVYLTVTRGVLKLANLAYEATSGNYLTVTRGVLKLKSNLDIRDSNGNLTVTRGVLKLGK